MSEAYDGDAEMENEKAEIAARIELTIKEISSIQKEFSVLLVEQKEILKDLEMKVQKKESNMGCSCDSIETALARMPIPAFLDKLLKCIVLCVPMVIMFLLIVSFFLIPFFVVSGIGTISFYYLHCITNQ